MEVMESLWLYHHPVYGLTSGRRAIDWLGRWLRIASLRHAMRQLGMEQPILWLCWPTTVDMVGHFNKALVTVLWMSMLLILSSNLTSVNR